MASTTSRPSTYSRVTPYLSARGPPAFSATLPPIEHRSAASWDRGVEEPVLLHLGLEDAGDDARLDARGEVVGLDLEDPVHPLQGERDATGQRRGSRRPCRCAPPPGPPGRGVGSPPPGRAAPPRRSPGGPARRAGRRPGRPRPGRRRRAGRRRRTTRLGPSTARSSSTADATAAAGARPAAPLIRTPPRWRPSWRRAPRRRTRR